ncbi:ImmA/IrrE family metallo-endopeptidase [Methylocystis sp. IM3]|uniref:ImmA/IrrE family metallo-endopeptidase n=1 Tax=unclassified Methylocystis TaxID=2625913 RepID=UPI0030FA89CC
MRASLNAISEYTQSAPVNVSGLAKTLGLRVIDANIGDASGKIERDLDGGYLITINARHSETRKRFTLAHEIAHYILHRHLIGDGIVDSALYRSDRGDAVERQANSYAASILMPAPLVDEKWKAGADTPELLAKAFHVSPTVAEIRIKELRLKSFAA